MTQMEPIELRELVRLGPDGLHPLAHFVAPSSSLSIVPSDWPISAASKVLERLLKSSLAEYLQSH